MAAFTDALVRQAHHERELNKEYPLTLNLSKGERTF
jgi:hypothetical protein